MSAQQPFHIPVLTPSWEEFKNFNQYIVAIEREAFPHKLSVAKVIPPAEWQRPDPINYEAERIEPFTIKTPLLQEFSGAGGNYEVFNTPLKTSTTVFELREREKTRSRPDGEAASISELEMSYFRSVSQKATKESAKPIYGADCHASLMGPTVREWNLDSLQTALDDTIVHSGGDKIKGLHTPFLYFGAWQTTFGLHTEDVDLYSLNYHHFGAPKYWLRLEDGHTLEGVFRQLVPDRYKSYADYHRHKTFVLSPAALQRHNIEFDRVLQWPGEFIVTFPYGYHGGFNCGLNCAEAVNFMVAPERWLEYGKRASRCRCQKKLLPLFSLAPFVQRYQPQLYSSWLSGKDFGPHPQRPGKTCRSLPPSLHDVFSNTNAYPGVIRKKSHKSGFDDMVLEDVPRSTSLNSFVSL